MAFSTLWNLLSFATCPSGIVIVGALLVSTGGVAAATNNGE